MKYGTGLYRAALMAMCVASLYLQNHYVTKETYEADRHASGRRIDDMQDALTTMLERNKVNDRQDAILQDHENRIRNLEFHEHK